MMDVVCTQQQYFSRWAGYLRSGTEESSGAHAGLGMSFVLQPLQQYRYAQYRTLHSNATHVLSTTTKSTHPRCTTP